MCICPQDLDSEPSHNHINDSTMTVASEVLVHPNMATMAMYTAATLGPQMARQFSRFSNTSVVDKVPPEMMHLVDPYWYFPFYHSIFVYFFDGTIFKMSFFLSYQASVPSFGSTHAHALRACNDRSGNNWMVWKRTRCLHLFMHSIPQDTKQHVGSKFGVLRFCYDGLHVPSHGHQLFL